MKDEKSTQKRCAVGVAIDLGTTTIVGSSVDGETGGVLGTLSIENPQVRYGCDVVSRMDALKADEGLLAALSGTTREALNSMIEDLAGPCAVAEVTVAGNSVMEHILLGLSPEPLSRPPFRPAFREAKMLEAAKLCLGSAGDASVYVFPLVGGFVGGDAVAVMLALGLKSTDHTVLAVDIGTNSEIILSSPKGIFATSAAAGPAFEGGEIGCGMRAEKGAVEGASLEDGTLKLEVIGGVAPRGICGSGLVALVARLLDAGVIDSTGRIRDDDEVPGTLADRIRRSGDGNSFVFFRGASGELSITQKDVRALQTAKSAIRAGINLLLKRAGVETRNVEKVYVAGAFGSNLEKCGLQRIGILDSAWLERTESVGDAALEGARLVLFSGERKKEAMYLARTVKYVPLSGSKHFESEFIKNMNF